MQDFMLVLLQVSTFGTSIYYLHYLRHAHMLNYVWQLPEAIVTLPCTPSSVLLLFIFSDVPASTVMLSCRVRCCANVHIHAYYFLIQAGSGCIAARTTTGYHLHATTQLFRRSSTIASMHTSDTAVTTCIQLCLY
jgi:hypothetical protein